MWLLSWIIFLKLEISSFCILPSPYCTELTKFTCLRTGYHHVFPFKEENRVTPTYNWQQCAWLSFFRLITSLAQFLYIIIIWLKIASSAFLEHPIWKFTRILYSWIFFFVYWEWELQHIAIMLHFTLFNLMYRIVISIVSAGGIGIPWTKIWFVIKVPDRKSVV